MSVISSKPSSDGGDLIRSPPRWLLQILLAGLLVIITAGTQATGTYQDPADFIHQAFSGNPSEPRVLWLTGEIKTTVTDILGHDYSALRVRYWAAGEKSAWILEEIGRDKPITVGLVVAQNRLEQIKVLIFRESRGWEVRHDFFTDQFIGSALTADRQLDRPIDGITGATLSVRALTKLSRLALYLHQIANVNDTP